MQIENIDKFWAGQKHLHPGIVGGTCRFTEQPGDQPGIPGRDGRAGLQRPKQAEGGGSGYGYPGPGGDNTS
jgi:hypothetical protein